VRGGLTPAPGWAWAACLHGALAGK
jgi:hypothetical protein